MLITQRALEFQPVWKKACEILEAKVKGVKKPQTRQMIAGVHLNAVMKETEAMHQVPLSFSSAQSDNLQERDANIRAILEAHKRELALPFKELGLPDEIADAFASYIADQPVVYLKIA